MSSDEYLSSKNAAIFSHFHMETAIDRVNFFEREFKFLDIFLGLLSFTDEPNMLDVTHKVHVLFQNAAVYFSEFDLDNSFDHYISKVRKGISLTKREIRDTYSFPKISLTHQYKDVTEFIDTVVARLNFLMIIDEEGSLIYVPNTMRSILKELELLQDFLQFVAARPIRPCIRKIYVDVLQISKSTIQSGCYPNIQIEPAVESEARFVETIIHNLKELLRDSNSAQRVALEDHLEILRKLINFLRPNIIHMPIQALEFLLRDIDTMIIDVGLLVYSLYEVEEEKIHGLGYVDFLLNNLKEFQRRYSDSLASVMNQLQIIQKELESSQPFLKAIAEEQLTYEVEYIVDATCISKEVPVWCLKRWFSDIVEEIKDIRAETENIEEKKGNEGAMNTVTTHTSSNLARTPKMNEEIVGFKDVIGKLRNQLIKGTKKRDAIAIVGMPGLGKTTLANRLYCDRLVVSHFEIRAQCCVSQVSCKDLLLAILRDVTGEDSKFRANSTAELADKLRKALYFGRYLILVDDVWETSVWDDLVGCFHDANEGSKIILTTRNHDVVNYARYKSEPHLLRMFSDDESWKLLRKKVFGEESCSTDLMEIGQQIAKKCGQLPLSVALVAGILEKMERKEGCWKQVANNLGPHIHRDSRAIIEHSYLNLPYHLRSCFLYFGAFLEDSAINVSELTRLWISEGFIKSCVSKSLQDKAVGYLDNLIRRNLVTVATRSSGGKVNACHVHDLLHDFCKERSKEENLLLLTRWDKNDSTDAYSQGQPAHRLSISDENSGHNRELSLSWSIVGSIILHNQCLSNFQVYDILHSFKFLKVLDLKSTTTRSYPIELVYLRYFAAATKKSIPSSIANLWNLDTLILENRHGGWSLPVILWKMVKLRHLNTREGFVTENAEELQENTSPETLSIAQFFSVKDVKLVLEKTPNLRKLSCELKSDDNFKDHELTLPPRLETLNIHGPLVISGKASPFCISTPNLKNLKITTFHLVPCHLSNIGLLQNLQVLKLYCITFDNEEWEVREGEFPQLRFLKLNLCDSVSEWIVSDDAFPNLECLFLRFCKNLQEIPSCFQDMSSLTSIEVDHCNKSVAKSARDIWKIQVEDYQNSGLQVLINGRGYVNSDSDDDDEQEKVADR
ncbi:hypothetical protein P3L10_030853 [Capsicum annuum]